MRKGVSRCEGGRAEKSGMKIRKDVCLRSRCGTEVELPVCIAVGMWNEDVESSNVEEMSAGVEREMWRGAVWKT